MPIVSPPIRGTGLLCIFRSAGKSISQCGPTFRRNAENQTVKAIASVKGTNVSIRLLGSIQNTFNSIINFFYNELFIKMLFHHFSTL